jgi:hypothetical protein
MSDVTWYDDNDRVCDEEHATVVSAKDYKAIVAELATAKVAWERYRSAARTAEDREDALLAALERYGKHEPMCAGVNFGLVSFKCICGFSEALRGTESKLRDGTSHPGYVIGVHWMTTAYDRICAGEPEEQVMSDYGYRLSFAGAIERAAVQYVKACPTCKGDGLGGEPPDAAGVGGYITSCETCGGSGRAADQPTAGLVEQMRAKATDLSNVARMLSNTNNPESDKEINDG